jgi:hypothetical protein
LEDLRHFLKSLSLLSTFKFGKQYHKVLYLVITVCGEPVECALSGIVSWRAQVSWCIVMMQP